MSARAKKKPVTSAQDAARWRRFLTNAPPLDDLIEIRRLHDNKTIIRRRADLPPSFAPNLAQWRPAS